MTFSSPTFLFIFFPVVLAGYFLIRQEYRNGFLALSSLVFYAWGEPKFLVVLIFSVLLNYIMGLLVDQPKPKWMRKGALLFSVAMNLGLLFVFKYLRFVFSSCNELLQSNLPLPEITLPIGISFFTFQGMSYVLDVYHKKVAVQKNPISVMLYVVMFPQLIAGPIVRYRDIALQIENREIGLSKLKDGIIRFIFGLSKKMIIANNMGATVDAIFALQPEELSVITTWLGAVCYAMQIYFDFSGYSDMAIGMGKMLGFEFQENFRYPYTSTSIKDFWRRWHISLSEWFRDYLYIPMGGSRFGNVYLHLFLVFLATGIWHGAAWTFLVWGIWHGLFRIIERILEKRNKHIKGFAGWLYTMLVVLIGWVIFRSDSLAYAVRYVERMFGFLPSTFIPYSLSWYFTPRLICVIGVSFVAAFLAGAEWMQRLSAKLEATIWYPMVKSMYLILILLYSIALVMTSTYNPFIYFRF